MRKLYIGTGDNQFKFADTTTEIHLNAYDDGSAATLTAGAKVKIKNDSGYLLGISASIDKSHAVITSGQLDKLPAGNYLLELWDTVDGGTAIYPSDGFLELQINENATGLSGGLVSSITVDDFIQQFSSLSEQLKQQVSDAVANGLKGDTGATGAKGDTGAQGVQGIQGDRGEQGETGPQGIQGIAGKDFSIAKTFPSVSSMSGDGLSTGDFVIISSTVDDPDNAKLYLWNGTAFTFVTDMSGATGVKGDTGAQGVQGEQGLQGEQGTQGIQGVQGATGPAGKDGAKGDTGEKGNPGKDFRIVKTFPSIAAMSGDGFSDGDFTMIASDVNDPDDGKLYVWNGTGFTYVADLSGSQGIKGDTGEKGDKGVKGDTGDQGISAYQVAVNAGFHGSVDQWLASLVGAKGDKGVKGDDAVINIVTQAQYDKLSDKSGVYFIEG